MRGEHHVRRGEAQARVVRLPGGGEYPTQDGFGWTNGVMVRLSTQYPELAAAR